MDKKKPLGDQQLWEDYKKGIKPLNTKDKIPLRKTPAPQKITIQPRNYDPFPPPNEGAAPQKSSRPKKGIIIQGTLDLHGLTREQAHRTLISFISRHQWIERRWVRVITGKGFRQKVENPDKKTLKEMLPIWLHEHPLNSLVSEYHYASYQDGGEGALNIAIKKAK